MIEFSFWFTAFVCKKVLQFDKIAYRRYENTIPRPKFETLLVNLKTIILNDHRWISQFELNFNLLIKSLVIMTHYSLACEWNWIFSMSFLLILYMSWKRNSCITAASISLWFNLHTFSSMSKLKSAANTQ